MNKYTTFFEDILKMLASFSIILLIAGYIDLKTYYDYFGINISMFVSASEILIVSLDNLSVVIISLAIQLIIWLSFFKYLFEHTEADFNAYWEGKARPKGMPNDLTMERFINSKNIRIYGLLLLSTSIIFIILKIIFPRNFFILQIGLFISINFWIFMLIYLAWLPLTRILMEIAKKQPYYNPRLMVTFAVFLPTFLFTIWVKNKMFVGNQLRKYGNKHIIEVVFQNGTTVATNDSIRYVGKTENYIFFWNKNSWTSTIYPVGDVKQIINYK